MDDLRQAIIAYAFQYQGDWQSIARALALQQAFQPVVSPPDCVTVADLQYPAACRQLRYPPWILFYAGDLQLLTRRAMTVIGSRMPTPYGVWVTDQIVSRLKHQFVIVSGLAAGIDATAHRQAITGGRTIGISGNGLDRIYPVVNAELAQTMATEHLILSEYPPGTPPLKAHFPWRNRILAALGEAMVVTQARFRSGTMLTVNEALQLAKDVYCVPHPLDTPWGEGCNQLISQGAGIIADVTAVWWQ